MENDSTATKNTTIVNLRAVKIDSLLLDYIDIGDDLGREFFTFDLERYWKTIANSGLSAVDVVAKMNRFLECKAAAEAAVDALSKSVRKYQ